MFVIKGGGYRSIYFRKHAFEREPVHQGQILPSILLLQFHKKALNIKGHSLIPDQGQEANSN